MNVLVAIGSAIGLGVGGYATWEVSRRLAPRKGKYYVGAQIGDKHMTFAHYGPLNDYELQQRIDDIKDLQVRKFDVKTDGVLHKFGRACQAVKLELPDMLVADAQEHVRRFPKHRSDGVGKTYFKFAAHTTVNDGLKTQLTPQELEQERVRVTNMINDHPTITELHVYDTSGGKGNLRIVETIQLD